MMNRICLALISAFSAILVTSLPTKSTAQGAVSTNNCSYWINVQTGKSWPSAPQGSSPRDYDPGSDHWTNPRNGKTYAHIPCPPPKTTPQTPPVGPGAPPPSPPPPSNPPVRTPTYSGLGVNPPPTAFQVGSVNFGSAVVTADYKYESPNIGPTEHSYGVDLGVLTNPFKEENDWLPVIYLSGGYFSTDPAHVTTTTWNAGAAAIWNMPSLRFGPAVGWQSNSTLGMSTKTWNYGGFAEWYPAPDWSLFTKLGGFSSNMAYDGFYASGAAKWYAIPDLDLNAQFDYTHSNNFGGWDEEDYTIGGEYLFSEKMPLALFAAYTYSDYSYNYHISAFNVGVKLYLNGEGVSTLVDRQRFGAPPPIQFKQ